MSPDCFLAASLHLASSLNDGGQREGAEKRFQKSYGSSKQGYLATRLSMISNMRDF